jgi:hypothetical protein
LSELFTRAGASIRHSDFVLDVGAGIRPQTFIKAKKHVCVEPHGEYADWLRDNGYCVLQSTAHSALSKVQEVDTVVMLDVIEHMTKAEGFTLLGLCKEKANQIVIFTPIGFCKQSYKEGEKDAWGMNGTYWQTHRSGWEPSEFRAEDGWTVHVDPTFHEGRNCGAFFAIWNRP